MSNTANLLKTSLPPHLSGASPTTYFVGNALFQNVMETGKKIFDERKQVSLETVQTNQILNGEHAGYTELHQVAFMETLDERMVVDSVESDYDKLNKRDNNGNTPLMWAASVGNEQLVELFIDQGAVINLQNFVGETALYIAAARGFAKICALLVDNGAQTHIATMDGASALHIAAASGHSEVVSLLVSRGAYVNSFDEEGDTPLHYAIREGRKPTIALLVQLGADFTIKNDDEESPLELAMDLGEDAVVQYLNGSSLGKTPIVTETVSNYPLFFGEENAEHHNTHNMMHTGDFANQTARSVSIF